MSHEDEQQVEPADCLRPEYCPDCGYILRGLPAEGRCPECGFAYGGDGIVLYGSGTAWRQEAPPLGALANILLALGAATLCTVYLVFRVNPGILFMCMMAWLFLLHTFEWLRRRARGERRYGRSQLRLFPEGFGQRQGYGSVKLRRWGPQWRWGPQCCVYIVDVEAYAAMRTPRWVQSNRWLRVLFADGFARGREADLGAGMREWHICIPAGFFVAFGSYGAPCVDFLVRMGPREMQMLRERLSRWRVLASAEENERFWSRYKEPDVSG